MVLLNLEWNNKIFPNKGNVLESDMIKTINEFKREDIFGHEYSVNDLFGHFYKDSAGAAKRQPNSFMIFRAIIGLVAAGKNIKIGDGTLQSKLAGCIWRGTSQEEKKRFEGLASEFKDLHKETFPNYEYKPKTRPPNVSHEFDTKTAKDYQLIGVNQHIDVNQQGIFYFQQQQQQQQLYNQFLQPNFPISMEQPQTDFSTPMQFAQLIEPNDIFSGYKFFESHPQLPYNQEFLNKEDKETQYSQYQQQSSSILSEDYLNFSDIQDPNYPSAFIDGSGSVYYWCNTPGVG